MLNIIKETPNYIIVFKNHGVLTEKSVYESNTLEDQVLEYLKSNSKSTKTPFLGIVHRLDRVTSGLILFAKKKSYLKYFNAEMEQRNIRKKYFALVKNKPQEDSRTLQNYILKNQKEKTSSIVASDTIKAKKAKLKFHYKGVYKENHLLEIELFTGRFHQIRTQLAHINLPIIGDEKYGSKEKYKEAIALQSFYLSFQDKETKECLVFEIKPIF